MSASSWVMLASVVFVLIPIPPFATILGTVLLLFGALMKKLA
ncbi:MAG: transporter [Bacteroidetes bacterium]|nr:transporter [Bacteroidota bacterium]